MAQCDLDFTALPILTGCPGASETFLVGNAVGGLDANGNYTVGYARRYWSDLQKCIVAGLTWFFQQFTVGQAGSLITQGSSVIIINQPLYLDSSLSILLNGNELPRNDNTQISYIYTFSGGNITIVFNQAAVNGQQYIIKYAIS